MTILVTGGTGVLGRPTVALLEQAGHDVRLLSRTHGDFRGDLTTGDGLESAFQNVHTVLHLATSSGAKDRRQTQNAVDAARAAQVGHFVYISIVGLEDVPYPYYGHKLASEDIVEQSGLAFTILRATQFHSFVAKFITMQRRLPFIIAVDAPVQPIAAEETAQRLLELVDAGPSGRVADIGGPELLQVADVIKRWQAAAGTHKKVWMLPLAGKTIRAFREGHHMTALPGFGRETFAEYAAREARK